MSFNNNELVCADLEERGVVCKRTASLPGAAVVSGMAGGGRSASGMDRECVHQLDHQHVQRR